MSKYVLRNISCTLDPASLQKAIDELERFQMDLKNAMVELINYLAQQGVKIAKAELLMFDDPGPAYYTGELSESIAATEASIADGEPTAGSSASVYAGAYYAIYVEFGTGIYAKNGGKRHGEPWIYLNKRDGKWHITNGMPARPFMHNTLNVLTDIAEKQGGEILLQYIPE